MIVNPPPAKVIACRDECGARVADDESALAAGWSYQSIRGAWRCGACAYALSAAYQITGTPAPTEFVDPLPPGSRGALRKETASTIAAPVVPSECQP